MNGLTITKDFSFTRASFLVVDNKVHFRDMVQSALNGTGARGVRHAGTIDKAIETLNRYGQEINCVISDWDTCGTVKTPDLLRLNGLDLLRLIRTRQLPNTPPRMPFVILTSNADAAAVKTALALDVNGFAVAPLSFEKLIRTIHLAMTRTWTLREPAHYQVIPVAPAAASSPPEPRVHVGKEPARRSEAPEMASVPPVTPPPTRTSRPRATAEDLVNVRMCRLKDVVPGQVLARDLRDKDGRLLLSTGAVLKPHIIDRLHAAEGQDDSYHLWVGDLEPVTAGP